MPNWCVNQFMVKGPAEVVSRFKTQAVDHYPWIRSEEIGGQPPSPLNFHSLVPIPAEVLKSCYADAGYNWEKKHWGAKLGACEAGLVDEWEQGLIYSFNTAWSPPIEFLERVSKQWPLLTFILEYDECGMGFKGIAKGHGEQVENHCVDY